MKTKILFLLFIALLFMSCGNVLEVLSQPHGRSNYVELPVGVVDAQTAWIWVSYNIIYDAYKANIQPTAPDIMATRRGDCKGFSILLAEMLYQLGYKGICIVEGSEPYGLHCIVYAPCLGGLIEPQSYGMPWHTSANGTMWGFGFKEFQRYTIETLNYLFAGGLMS